MRAVSLSACQAVLGRQCVLSACQPVSLSGRAGSAKTSHRHHHEYDYHHSHRDDDCDDDDDYDDDVGHQIP